jgi:ADP-ribosylglycohydrolase
MTTASTTDEPRDAARDAFLGSLVADAVAMPVHWYYDRQALDRDYPDLLPPPRGPAYLAPRSPHADSILWRSQWTPPGPKFDILRDQAAFWGRRGIHYHQFLTAGENTLNFRLATELFAFVRRHRDYDPLPWLDLSIKLMLEPGWHRDTYVEEYHRHFFTNLGAGRKPASCGVRDVHIGGLVPVPALVAALGPRHPDLRRIVRLHVGLTHKDDDVLAAADALVRILTTTLGVQAGFAQNQLDRFSGIRLRHRCTIPDDAEDRRIGREVVVSREDRFARGAEFAVNRHISQ